MNKKLIFVYEPDGLGNARRKISKLETDEIKTDSFDFMPIEEFIKSNWLNPDFLILEDEAQYQIELIGASLNLEQLSLIVICDSLSTIEGVIEALSQSPKVITLDYKIGANNSPENLPAIYRRIRERFKTSAVIGYTNFGRKKADKEFSAKSADELTELLRNNGEAVIEKSGMTKAALSSILFDRMQVQNLRRELIVSSNENQLLRKTIEAQEDIFAEKIKAYTESVAIRNLDRPIIGFSLAIKKIKYFIEKYAKSDIPVLILGEQGTGKELIARAIHRLSKRCSEDKFITVDCGAIPEGLFESELFGYEAGAHNKADKLKKGYIEGADKGTLFLDEIGNLDYVSQTKLLRALQEKKIRRLGSNKEIEVDFRLISATNKNIPELISKGKFHADLYQRVLSYFPIAPSLRDRSEDIPILIEYFTKKAKATFTLSSDAKEFMIKYHWEGNVRQLELFIENLCVIFDDETVSKKEVSALLNSNQSSMETIQVVNKVEDCTEAAKLLDEINTFLETNPKYKDMRKITNLEEFATDFVGKSRNTLHEKRKKLTPCFNILINQFPDRWNAIRIKEMKVAVKENRKK